MDPLFRDVQETCNAQDQRSSHSSSAETTPQTAPTPQSQDSTQDSTQAQRPGESTGAYLERLSASMMEALNERTFENHPILSYLSPNFRASLDSPSSTAEEILVHFHKLVEVYPETHVRAVETKAYVYPNLGKADVYMNLEGTGNPPGLVRQGFCQLDWELVDGKWTCVRHKGLGGTVPQDPDRL
ncbi:Hypothetical predicted protein [Lecanosticta acicola]|uniref:DUF4440 domain-containing protein n=1 Tax=Lecanosticta acicola TaxID=111012 RepID=A0AAI8Z3H6_9PEZI|nr:Hypothetical predicted protein [Lecanosticta acicola]